MIYKILLYEINLIWIQTFPKNEYFFLEKHFMYFHLFVLFIELNFN